MKVLYIAHSEKLQGSGFALLNLIEQISKLGIQPIIVIPQKGELSKKLDALGYSYRIVNTKNCIYPPYVTTIDKIMWFYRLCKLHFVNFIAFLKLLYIIRVENPNIIHTNTGVVRYGFWAARLCGIPHVWHIREFQSQEFSYYPIGGTKYIRRLFNNANTHCIAITNAVFDYFFLNNDKDITIYDGVFSKSIVTNNAAKKPYFLFVGSLQVGKGICDVLDAFENVAEKIPTYELWLVGNDFINIDSYTEKSKYANRIKYLGFRNDIYDLMSHATAFIMSSHFEGFGFTTAEAMLNKTLVIGRNIAGTKEQFDNGHDISGAEIGLRYNNIAGLSEHLVSIVTNGIEYYHCMIENAYKTVLKLYTIEDSAKRVYDFYNTIIK